MPAADDVLSGSNFDIATEFDELESSVRIYCRTFDCLFGRAKGAFLYDHHNRSYIDFLSGAGSLNYGHNHPAIKRAVIDYLEGDGVVHSLDLYTTAKLAFLRKFRDVILVPRGLDYRVQFCGPTGTDAVEAALKLVRKVTGRQNIVAFSNAYHGVSLGALAATASSQKRASAGIALENVMRMPFEGFAGVIDGIALVERMLAPGGGIEPPGGIIVETVQGEGGLNVASIDWLRRLSELAKRIEVPLIVDEIQTGCGRTGTFFSFERAGIRPDIVCVSKSISGLGLPLALVLIEPSLDQWGPGDHAGTFRGSNLAFVGATAALDFWLDGALLEHVNRRGKRMREHLLGLVEQHPDQCAGVRGIGMMQGIAWHAPQIAAAVSRAAFAHGLIVETCGALDEVTKLLPPLTIDDQVLDEGLSRLSMAVADVMRDPAFVHPPGRSVGNEQSRLWSIPT